MKLRPQRCLMIGWPHLRLVSDGVTEDALVHDGNAISARRSADDDLKPVSGKNEGALRERASREDTSARWPKAPYSSRCTRTGTTAIAAIARASTLEFAPLLILDAGGELAMTYHAWGEGRGNLRQLPSASKTYHNLTTHYWDHRAGKTAHGANKIIDELAGGVASAIAQIPEEEK